MMRNSSQDFSPPTNFAAHDIEEVEVPSNEGENNVVNAGKVEAWKRPEATEKAKARPYITGIVMSIWAVWTIVGLIRVVVTGDTSLIITSPTLLVVLLVKFYFKSD